MRPLESDWFAMVADLAVLGTVGVTLWAVVRLVLWAIQ